MVDRTTEGLLLSSGINNSGGTKVLEKVFAVFDGGAEQTPSAQHEDLAAASGADAHVPD